MVSVLHHQFYILIHLYKQIAMSYNEVNMYNQCLSIISFKDNPTEFIN